MFTLFLSSTHALGLFSIDAPYDRALEIVGETGILNCLGPYGTTWELSDRHNEEVRLLHSWDGEQYIVDRGPRRGPRGFDYRVISTKGHLPQVIVARSSPDHFDYDRTEYRYSEPMFLARHDGYSEIDMRDTGISFAIDWDTNSVLFKTEEDLLQWRLSA